MPIDVKTVFANISHKVYYEIIEITYEPSGCGMAFLIPPSDPYGICIVPVRRSQVWFTLIEKKLRQINYFFLSPKNVTFTKF